MQLADPWIASTFFLAGLLVGIIGTVWASFVMFNSGGKDE